MNRIALLISGTVGSAALAEESATAPADPVAEVRWKSTKGTVSIVPPVGEHVALDAPVHGWVSVGSIRTDWQTLGSIATEGLSLSWPQSDTIEIVGALQLSLCEDGGSLCRVTDITFEDKLNGRRGKQVLAPSKTTTAEQSTSSTTEPSHGLSPEMAFKNAQANGTRVLLDFSATWCPPCQLLAATVLHDLEDAALLAPFEVVELDADHQDSWPWKDRFEVGGYPTLIIADASGSLIARLEGFPGEADTHVFLKAGAKAWPPISELLRNLDAISPESAASAARRLAVEGHREIALQVLGRASQGVERELVTFELNPTIEGLDWCIEQAPDHMEAWIWTAYDLFSKGDVSPERVQTIQNVLAAQMTTAPPFKASEYAWIAAKLAPAAESKVLFASAAAILHGSFTGDPIQDRGHYAFLADLQTLSGNKASALATLRKGAAEFPEEFTFHFAVARQLQDMGRHSEALVSSQKAAGIAYGDMTIRSAMQQATILASLDRTAEGVAVLTAALDQADRPSKDTDVRTHRYLRQAEEQLVGLVEGPQEP